MKQMENIVQGKKGGPPAPKNFYAESASDPTKIELNFIKKAISCHVEKKWGGITELAEEYNTSRKEVYKRMVRGNEIIEKAVAESSEKKSKSYAEISVDQSHLERSVIALYTEGPNSIRDIVAQIEVLFGFHLSYGSIQSILAEASQRARKFNEAVSLSAVNHCALDEMFSQGDPVLAGIDLDSRFTFLLSKSSGRSGNDWEKALSAPKERQGLDPDVFVKDAGTGLREGVKRVFPNAQQRDDIFHAQYKMNKVKIFYERRALSALAAEWELEKALMAVKKEGNKRSISQKLRHCRDKSEKLMDIHDNFEKLCVQAVKWMDFIDAETGKIRTGAECAAGLRETALKMKQLKIPRISAVAGYLYKKAEGLSLWVDEIIANLEDLKQTLAVRQESEKKKSSLFRD